MIGTRSDEINFEKLKSPIKKAPVEITVAYEIFCSTSREILAYKNRTIARLERTPALVCINKYDSDDDGDKVDISAEAAEKRKREIIQSIKEETERLNMGLEPRIREDLTKDKERYIKFKSYFEKKIAKLKLEDSLIFFDDETLRIEMGYGPKEFEALFFDFEFPMRPIGEELVYGRGCNLQYDYNENALFEQKRLSLSADNEFKKTFSS